VSLVLHEPSFTIEVIPSDCDTVVDIDGSPNNEGEINVSEKS